MSAPQRFDVHVRTGSLLTGYGTGPFLVTIEARDHRTAKHDADELFTEPVVVLPHREPTEKLEQALAKLCRRATSKHDFRRRNTSASERGAA